ncbi:MAG: hypothetical protein GJ676_13215 [Rhodobacteraceae bacterium]|nr:hypothetical protein [Paracoccaceae bacterium]
MPHDFNAQRAETVAAYDTLQAEQGLPDLADVDYFFVARNDAADWRPLADQLSRDGYDCQYVEDDDEADGPYLVATLPDQIISAGGIWIGEEVATRAALEHGFTPDGWGLEG